MDDLKAQANAMLEAHLGYDPQLLAAAKAQMEEQASTSPEAFRRTMDNSPEGKIKKCRTDEATIRQYQVFSKALDDPIKKLFLEMTAGNNSSDDGKVNNTRTSFPAVDLAAGSAYFTSQWALRYREPLCAGSLEWYPTDTNDAVEKFTRPCLTYLAEEAEQHSFLCADRHGDAVFRQDRIILEGLKTVEYNGQEGVLLHKDPKIAGRYAVRLDRKAKPMSFKAANFVVRKGGPGGNEDTTSRTTEEQNRRLLSSQNYLERDLFRGLLERSCDLDLLKRETWSELLEKLNGQCALVTCTNLLTEIGHREPTVWKTVMEVASKLLFSGGFLLQGDADGWGQFGNVQIMEEHAKLLGLTLHTQVKLNAWALVLWKKR